MTTSELTRAIFQRLKRYRYIIIAAGLIASALLIFYALQTPVKFTSRGTVFPLTSGSENTSATSAISVLLGGGTDSKNFSDDASISIIELAQSRTTREAVSAMPVPAMGNKMISELLLNDINTHLGLMENKVKTPPNRDRLIVWGGDMLKKGLTATINKNNMLVLTYTGRNEDLIKVISYGFIDKISQFYINLKKEKSERDFQFASSKVDSLRRVMNAKDYQLIAIDKRTLFTNTNKLEYRVPTENLLADKQMIRSQYAQAVGNQQNAAYKLQKATPLIKILDKPDPPYEAQMKSPKIYAIIGFIAGIFLSIAVLISGLLFTFMKAEATKAIFGSGTSKTTTTTTSVL
jgi:uncharacterized protein involved in exopolysaccharide biosynthesis